MSRLLVYISGMEQFDAERVRNFPQSCPGVSNVAERPDERVLLTAQFDLGTDSTIFELKANTQTVAISGIGPASIRLCWLFQQYYPQELHVTDDNYCIDLMISDFGSVNALGEAMLDAIKSKIERPD